MFSPTQMQKLKAKLPAEVIKKRQGGRSKDGSPIMLSYIEGWYAIEKANEIFGFGNWSRETVSMTCVHDETIEERGYNGKPTAYRLCAYVAKVRITVTAHDGRSIVREGTGFGKSKTSQLHEAHENAVKEAETDAMKRALMTFGDPFGLTLYDKEQANVDWANVDREEAKTTQPMMSLQAKVTRPVKARTSTTPNNKEIDEETRALAKKIYQDLRSVKTSEDLERVWQSIESDLPLIKDKMPHAFDKILEIHDIQSNKFKETTHAVNQ